MKLRKPLWLTRLLQLLHFFIVCIKFYKNDMDYGEDSIFSSGTLTVSKDDNAFTYKVTGVLKNGKSVSFHIYVPASEWDVVEFK